MTQKSELVKIQWTRKQVTAWKQFRLSQIEGDYRAVESLQRDLAKKDIPPGQDLEKEKDFHFKQWCDIQTAPHMPVPEKWWADVDLGRDPEVAVGSDLG